MAVVQEECDQVTQEIEKNVKFRSLRETIREMHQQVCDQVTQAMEKNEKFRLRETIREMYQQVCDQVTQEMEKNTKPKPVLSFLQATLNSLRSDEIFQGLQIFNDQDKMIMKFMALYLDEGVKLLAEVSKLRLWDYYFWLDSYTDRLVHLDLVLMIFQRWMRTPPNNKFETVPLKAEVQLGREQVAAQAAFQRLFEAVIEGEEWV